MVGVQATDGTRATADCHGAAAGAGGPMRVTALSLSMLVGVVALAGWLFGIPMLDSVLPGLTTMKANTAVGVLACGAGLALLPGTAGGGAATWRRWLGPCCGALALAVGVSALVEYGAGLRLGIDELLFSDPDTTSAPYAGRMAPTTAVAVACAGVSVLLLWLVASWRPAERLTTIAVTTAHGFAGIPAVGGYLGLTAYVYDVEGLHSFGPFATVALNTAAAALLLSVALFLTYPDMGWRRRFVARPVTWRVFSRLLPVALLVPFVAGSIVVWGARRHLYDPLYGPALFALASALTVLGLAWDAASAVRRAEGGLEDLSGALRESEARFRAITDAMPQMVWSARPDGYHDYYNEQWYVLTGTTRDQVAGEGRRTLLHPDDRDRAWTRWQHSLATGEPYEMETRLRMADGAYRWFLGRALPLRDGSGAVSRWFGTCTDIEQTVAARDALARSRLELERLVAARTQDLQETQTRLAHVQRMEALGQLAGGIAHDFNNVLQAVQSAAALLDRRTGDPDGVRRLSRMIFEAAGRGNAITRRLLAFSRRGDLHAEPLDPAPVLADIRDILSHTLGTVIEVRTAATAGLPRMLADLGQLETVLINLATNARDAMPQGGLLSLVAAQETVPEAASMLVPLTPGRYIRLAVSDTGVGMDPATLARACEPFFTTKPVGEGTGLGLAMARGFAEQSGGGLHIESTPGRGTVVTLWFPVTDAAPAIAAPPASPVPARARLLLVDDEAMVRDILAEEMEAAGYGVIAAASGEAALALLAAGEPVDLLITDLSMPGMDGLALIREVRLRRAGLPAILLTGHATNAAEIAVGGALSGTLSLLRKPVRGIHLAERVAALLEAAREGVS